jgi:ribosome-associated protein
MKIDSSEFVFQFARSSGPGGQNVNKVNTKVTLSWNIDESNSISHFVKKRFVSEFTRFITSEGLVKITSQKYRVQSRNIADCIMKLHELLKEVEKPPKRRVATKPTRASVKKRIQNKKFKSDIKKTRQKVKGE